MNIDHGVRNSIYRTGRAAALRARLTTASFTKENILHAFNLTGVWPMDPEPVFKRFPLLTTDNQEDLEFGQLEKVLC
jgi:hypothetical protein